MKAHKTRIKEKQQPGQIMASSMTKRRYARVIKTLRGRICWETLKTWGEPATHVPQQVCACV